MLEIEYESEGFPQSGSLHNGPATLQTSWNELLWAAVTVGRPNRAFVFRHGNSSMYEAIFRWSLVRMAVEQSSPGARRFRRTAAARTLDPTEKGAVSYFLGMTFCKLFAAKLLDTPWLLHLDVFGSQLGAVLTGRSRPDLIGKSSSGKWVSFESKGRVSPPDETTISKAVRQAERCTEVDNQAVSFHIGGILYVVKDVYRFHWRDPEPDGAANLKGIRISMSGDDWFHYYAPVLGIVRTDPERYHLMQSEPVRVPVAGADLEVGINSSVLLLLAKEKWAEVRDWCIEHASALREAETQADGIQIVAGKSWLTPFASIHAG